MSEINGFKIIPWPELKKSLLALPPIQEPVMLDSGSRIIEHTKFIEHTINIIDAAPPNRANITDREARQRQAIKPYYERLLKYYNLRTRLIEA